MQVYTGHFQAHNREKVIVKKFGLLANTAVTAHHDSVVRMAGLYADDQYELLELYSVLPEGDRDGHGSDGSEDNQYRESVRWQLFT